MRPGRSKKRIRRSSDPLAGGNRHGCFAISFGSSGLRFLRREEAVVQRLRKLPDGADIRNRASILPGEMVWCETLIAAAG